MSKSRDIGVYGAGDMGHGFAAHFALHGHDVTLLDHRQSNLDEARERIRDVVSFLRDEEITEQSPEAVVSSVEYTLDSESGLPNVGLVLESVPKELDLKHEVFREIAAAAPDDAMLASNTSGLPITEISTGVPGHVDRVVGCHWWYPPYLLPTVEVVRGGPASLQVDAWTPNAFIQEQLIHRIDRDVLENFMGNPEIFDFNDDRVVAISNGPGLGIAIDEEHLREAEAGYDWNPTHWRHPDRSVADK